MHETRWASAAESTCTLPENAKIVDVNGERLYTREYVDAERKATIERCAALCESKLVDPFKTPPYDMRGLSERNMMAGVCAAAIRALLEE